MATETPTGSHTRRDVRAYTWSTSKSAATEQVGSHRPCHLFEQRHRLEPHQGDQQRKQQNGPIDQGSDTDQEGTRQVDEPRRGILSTSTHICDCLLSAAVVTPGRQSFRRKQQRLPKRQQQFQKGCIIDEST